MFPLHLPIQDVAKFDFSCCSQFGFCGLTEEFCNKTGNTNTTCQSNCDQPGSGASGGDVQSRIIGYYEGWNANKDCIGMVNIFLVPKATGPAVD